jgi:alpha amylase-like protein
MRPHPHLYEINTWPWLERLSREAGRLITLGTVPDLEWDRLGARGFDVVYLMGVWRRSAFGRHVARSEPALFAAYDAALPGWGVGDVVGSAYCVSGYDPDPRVGTAGDLHAVRQKLHARGMELMLDFIPNHVGFDHPWIATHPDRFVNGTEKAFRHNPSAFRLVELPSGEVRFIACGRDPYFTPWTDVAQLDYTNPDTRSAMILALQTVAQHADGARCDMAMLVLSDVFSSTWRSLTLGAPPAREFWADARAAVPGFTLLAEVYWDLEWRLQQLGFDFTYDKRLYERLLHGPARDVRGHLRADAAYQARSARFIENHDEQRSASAFGPRVTAAAVVMSTLQGLRFYYDGQFEGRRVRAPVQLGVERHEPVDEHLSAFYSRLLSCIDASIFHDGEWRLCDVAGDGTSGELLAWRWAASGDVRLVVVNVGGMRAEGHVEIAAELPAGDAFTFVDLLDGHRYEWTRVTLVRRGLYIRLEGGQAHIFSVTRAEPDLNVSSRTGER